MLLNCVWGLDSPRDPWSKMIPRLGAGGGSGLQKSCGGGSGEPSSSPGFAPLRSAVCARSPRRRSS